MKPQPKPVTQRHKAYLKWLRTQPCVNCGRYANPHLDIVPMHTGGGMAIKGDDTKALPGCVECHAEEHRQPMTFWGALWYRYGTDRDGLCTEHWERYQKETT